MRFANDVLTFLGVTNGGGRWYLWWSGMFGNLTIFAALAVFYRKHNCHIYRCWRIGRHSAVDTDGREHMVCRHHHPDLGPEFHLRPHHLVANSMTPATAQGASR